MNFAYGSTAFGGIAGGPATPTTTVTPSTLTLTLTLNAPTISIVNGFSPNTFALTLTLNAPTVIVVDVETPATFNTTLTLNAPIPVVVPAVATLALTSSLEAAAPVVVNLPGTFSLVTTGLDVLIPTVAISSAPGPIIMTVSAGFAPHLGSLAPTIVRFIKDPIVTGGCPQCGTFLYKQNGRRITSEDFTTGLNDADREDDEFVRCGRCKFMVKLSRHTSHPRGSRVGWGMKYDEIEAGS